MKQEIHYWVTNKSREHMDFSLLFGIESCCMEDSSYYETRANF